MEHSSAAAAVGEMFNTCYSSRDVKIITSGELVHLLCADFGTVSGCRIDWR